ncbi:MAG: pectate lyase [Tannerella sp.]|nr:pectate lyase [Tannerella sp.]
MFPGEDGRLVYRPYTGRGDIVPDFSWCGYMGGGVDLPEVDVVAVITAAGDGCRGDDAPRIQAVIDSVSGLPSGADGFRGAILLRKGCYRISSSLRITGSGIVLRGEGNDRFSGTALLATSPHRYPVIEIGVPARFRPVAGSERAILDDYVPSGTRVVHVRNASACFRPGDDVVVRRPSTEAWIRTLGMDSIPPRPLPGESTHDSFRRFRQSGGNTDMNGTNQWLAGSKDLNFERRVVAVGGDSVTLDIPLTNALQKEYGGGVIFRYEFPERIDRCGVEYVYGLSAYDESVKLQNRHIGLYSCDENHANVFISVHAAENVWIRKVNVESLDCCVRTDPSSKFVTGQDLSAIHPVSEITGGRRYAYSISGQMVLFERCYASYHRHEFVLGATVAGPNAFVSGSGDMTFASSEPHQRWATGCLYDNITVRGPEGSLLAVNRGWFGSGHGWSGAQMVFWNCSAPVIMVMQPPTAQNFVIGNGGPVTEQQAALAREQTVKSINNVSRSHFTDTGAPPVGDGWIEHPAQSVTPRSLYYAQLRDRKKISR